MTNSRRTSSAPPPSPPLRSHCPCSPSTRRTRRVGAPSPIKLGLASYTFRNFPRAQMIAWMKQLNITGLNAKDAKDHLPMDPTAEAQAFLTTRPPASICTLPAPSTSRRTKTRTSAPSSNTAKRAGVKVIVAGDPAPATLPRMEKFVKEYDIRIAIHNHGPEDKIFHSPLDVLKVVKSMDPRMGCCIDVGHCVRAGTDVVEAIHAAGPRLFNMHMKDLTSFTSKRARLPSAKARCPSAQIFEALIKIKYPGWVDLEYEVHGDDPMPGVTESFAYMRGVLAGWVTTRTRNARDLSVLGRNGSQAPLRPKSGSPSNPETHSGLITACWSEIVARDFQSEI